MITININEKNTWLFCSIKDSENIENKMNDENELEIANYKKNLKDG